MIPATVHTFDNDIETITIGQALDEIHRTRRQVDRFEYLPCASGRTISPQDAATIREKCDALEAKLRRLISHD